MPTFRFYYSFVCILNKRYSLKCISIINVHVLMCFVHDCNDRKPFCINCIPVLIFWANIAYFLANRITKPSSSGPMTYLLNGPLQHRSPQHHKCCMCLFYLKVARSSAYRSLQALSCPRVFLLTPDERKWPKKYFCFAFRFVHYVWASGGLNHGFMSNKPKSPLLDYDDFNSLNIALTLFSIRVFAKNLLRGNRRKNVSFWCLTWGTNSGFMSISRYTTY